ncbi:hypothetical protein F4678DRAFT_480816 [Xylaria arbuscula]|nr:hypothetical protein F4678DRAFT_480816 [Xylaria arbuscula]
MNSIFEIETERRRFETFFANERFRFEGIISHGVQGVTLQVTELRPFRPLAPAVQPQGRKRKRFRAFTPKEIYHSVKRLRLSSAGTALKTVVTKIIPSRTTGNNRASPNPDPVDQQMRPRTMAIKRSLRDAGAEDLRHEIEILRRLNGSMHIVGLIAYRDDPIAVAKRLSYLSPPKTALGQGDFLAGLVGPVLVMEYLDNGTLRRFRRRLEMQPDPVPNPVRAVIAIAYPKAYDPDTTPTLEQLPAPDVQPSDLMHNDLHDNNIMFGPTDRSTPEHSLFPMMKLLDFGSARDLDKRYGTSAVEHNLFDVSEIIYNLIPSPSPLDSDDPFAFQELLSRYQEIETYATNLSDEAGRNLDLDTDLRDLICRSMAADVKDRPNLPEMLRITSQAVENKSAASFMAYRTAETDEDIRHLLQRMIYDADPVPGSSYFSAR